MKWLDKLHIKIVNSQLWHNLYYKHTTQHKQDMAKVASDTRSRMLRRMYDFEIIKYPCLTCEQVGLSNKCVATCESVLHDDGEISKLVLKTSCCPDCGGLDLLGGPSGGVCQNVKCNKCGHEFNFCLGSYMHRIYK